MKDDTLEIAEECGAEITECTDDCVVILTGKELEAFRAEIERRLVVTTDEDGKFVCLSRQDNEGRILKVLVEATPSPKEES